MLVSDAMVRPAVTVRTDTPIEEALDRLDRHSLTVVPVLSPAGFFVGVVREADLVRAVVKPNVRSGPIPARRQGNATSPRPTVLQVMNHLAVSISGEADVSAALALIGDAHVESLPVDAHHRVIGVIGLADIDRQARASESPISGAIPSERAPRCCRPNPGVRGWLS